MGLAVASLSVTCLMIVSILYCEKGIRLILYNVNKTQVLLQYTVCSICRTRTACRPKKNMHSLRYWNKLPFFSLLYIFLLSETASSPSSHNAFHLTCLLLHSCVPIQQFRGHLRYMHLLSKFHLLLKLNPRNPSPKVGEDQLRPMTIAKCYVTAVEKGQRWILYLYRLVTDNMFGPLTRTNSGVYSLHSIFHWSISCDISTSWQGSPKRTMKQVMGPHWIMMRGDCIMVTIPEMEHSSYCMSQWKQFWPGFSHLL